MKKFDLEVTAGLFMVAGILCLGYLSVKLGRMEVLASEGYEVYAVFTDVGGLKEGAQVVIAGVEVGRVKQISLEDYEARVIFDLDEDVRVQTDAMASIRTRGLVGEKYVEITAGGAEEIVQPGGRIRDTEPAVNLESLLSKYVFGKL